jgi:hypothetical protein
MNWTLPKNCKFIVPSIKYDSELPYFPVDNARVIYTKMFSKREKTTVRIILKVRVMQLKSKNSKMPKYGPGHSQSNDSMYFHVRGKHKVRGIY